MTTRTQLDTADQALTDIQDCDDAPDTEAFASSVESARAAINAARALTIDAE